MYSPTGSGGVTLLVFVILVSPSGTHPESYNTFFHATYLRRQMGGTQRRTHSQIAIRLNKLLFRLKAQTRPAGLRHGPRSSNFSAL